MIPTRPHVAKRRSVDMNRLMRELTHDMNANFMVLQDSFEHLKQQVDETPVPKLLEGAAHVEACLSESKRLIDDLVTLAKTGAVQMEPARVGLADVVAETLFEQEELVKQHGVDVEVLDEMPAVSCNRKRLKQILTNLVRNAVIHGCDPQIPRITIRANQYVGGNTRLVKLVIHDNGSGVPRTAAEEIFLPGARLGESRKEGSGMGLAIVRRIAEHYGGSASLDADCFCGTSLVVTLPVAMPR